MHRIVQVLQLTLTLLSLYGYLRFCMRAFRMRVELALPVVFAGIGLLTFISGLLGLLLPGALLLLAVGLVLAVRSFIKREALGQLISPGSVAFGLMALFSAYIVLGQVFFNVDDFSHWATVVKEMLYDNSFPTAEDALVYFPHYPLASSSLVYWFCTAAGIRSEWFQMLAQALLISACLASLFALAPRGKGIKSALSYAALGIFALSVFCSNIELISLYVDDLLAVLGLAAIAVWAAGRQEKRTLWPLMMICVFLSMVKQSGIFFALIPVAILLADRHSPAGGWKPALLVLLGLAAVELAWSLHVDAAFPSAAEGASSAVFPGLAGKSREDVLTIISSMTATVLHPAKLLPLLAAAGLAMYMARYCGHRNTLISLAVSAAAVWLLYCAGQAAMYILFMERGEAVRLAAFERYFATIQCFSFGSLLLLVYELGCCRQGLGRGAAALGLGVVLAVSALAPSPAALLRMEQRVPAIKDPEAALPDAAKLEEDMPYFWAALRARYDSLIDRYDIPGGLTYTIYMKNDHGIEARLLSNYLLSSRGTFVCTDEQLEEKGGMGKTLEYYIVLEPSEANMSFIRDTFSSEFEAGYSS